MKYFTETRVGRSTYVTFSVIKKGKYVCISLKEHRKKPIPMNLVTAKIGERCEREGKELYFWINFTFASLCNVLYVKKENMKKDGNILKVYASRNKISY